MRVTVCEMPDGWTETDAVWQALGAHLQSAASDLLLLPEMPFFPWIAGTAQVDPRRWDAAVVEHDEWIARLAGLPVPRVAASRPIVEEGRRLNAGFIWHHASGCHRAHTKYYLPDEPGFWEASWYQRGADHFQILEMDGIRIGFLICTELWFNERARAYAESGIHLLLCPRVTPAASTRKWIAGGVTAAVVSGAFCLSSNLRGPQAEGPALGGTGWIIAPEEGEVLGITTLRTPFLTLEIDLAEAERAKNTYPRYVPD
jgi:N-carbamoylputrescine amidase